MATNMDLNKIQAPALKLYEFNYFANKAVNRYINRIYSAYYDINQQSTDDLRVLKSTVVLKPANKVNTLYGKNFHGAQSYEVQLPGDYLHLLICVFNPKQDYLCYDKNEPYAVAAKRLTADSWANVLDDVYNAPSALNPYYYIHNVNNYSSDATGHSTPVEFQNQYELPITQDYKGNGDSPVLDRTSVTNNSQTSEITYSPETGPDTKGNYTENVKIKEGNVVISDTTRTFTWDSETKTHTLSSTVSTTTNNPNNTNVQGTNTFTKFPRTINLKGGETTSTIEKKGGLRNANPVGARMEIRCGDTSICELEQIHVDYIKAPQYLRLTQKQYDSTLDISQVLEFPDYICQEIENELLTIIMEHMGDPRLKNVMQINQTIARPNAQQQES